jgi:hypothetical protein
MLVALSALASVLSKATEAAHRTILRFMDYCSTHPDATVRYQASDMQLKIHSDASYLNAPKARSRVGGHFYLGNRKSKVEVQHGAILHPTGVLKHVVSAASDAKVGGLFINCKEGTAIRITLGELGHPQGPTPVQTDNSTASGIANDTIKQQRSKAMDMRFYWVRNHVRQGEFTVY